MASARAWVVIAVLLVCLAELTDGFLWPSSSRRRRRRRCPSPQAVVSGAINSWDQTFTFQCPGNRAVSRVQSAHCNTAEDRVWKFECKYASGIHYLTRSYWTGWVNDYDGSMAFNCPFNSVVTGFKSEHSNGHEDRRWKVRCSKRTGMVTRSCFTTGYVNNWDHAMDYFVPAPYYLAGMHGYHDNGKEDRRYKFTLCKINP